MDPTCGRLYQQNPQTKLEPIPDWLTHYGERSEFCGSNAHPRNERDKEKSFRMIQTDKLGFCFKWNCKNMDDEETCQRSGLSFQTFKFIKFCRHDPVSHPLAYFWRANCCDVVLPRSVSYS